jgi:hypothetical protein
MATQKRQVAGVQIDVAAVVHRAIEAVDAMMLDLVAARNSLRLLGHTNPATELIERYAREEAILAELQRRTRANTTGQMGKWDMSSEAKIVEEFGHYLNRRINGQHQRFTAQYGRR